MKIGLKSTLVVLALTSCLGDLQPSPKVDAKLTYHVYTLPCQTNRLYPAAHTSSVVNDIAPSSHGVEARQPPTKALSIRAAAAAVVTTNQAWHVT